jgi:two-component system, NarL family, sensor kinase
VRGVRPGSSRPQSKEAGDDDLVDIVERDRASIAARLHDGPVQTLTAASLRLQSAVHFDELTPAVAREVAAGISEAATELRTLMSEIVAWDVGATTLEDAIRRRVEDACSATGVRLELGLDVSEALPTEASSLVLHLVQDIVADAIHQADAAELELALEQGESGVVVRARHDGRAADPSRRLGLVLLRRRAEAAGGRVEIDTAAEGTSIRVVVPVQSRPEESGR